MIELAVARFDYKIYAKSAAPWAESLINPALWLDGIAKAGTRGYYRFRKKRYNLLGRNK
jgi:hypothetical protein